MSERPKDPRDFWTTITTSRLSALDLLSPPSDARTADVHRQALDDEIAAMSVALSSMKERRNLFHHKPKFPPEVLEYIFAYVALDEIPGRGRTGVKESIECRIYEVECRIYEILGWVKLTHVCRAWRAIALAEGNRWLWSTVDTARLSAEGMYEILDRSHPHPITANVTISVHPDEFEVFGILLEPKYMSRLKSLQIMADEHVHLDAEDPDLMGQVTIDHADNILRALADDGLSAPGLMIESLVVAYTDSTDSDFALSLPYRLLAPHLRHLTLKNVHLSLDEDIVTYPQLTHLDITVDLQKDTDNHIDEFLEFLRGSPNLQVLRLIESLPMMELIESISEEHIDAFHVDLLCLQELQLDGPYLDCSRFGKCLNLPDTCAITINAVCRRLPVDPAYKHLGSLLTRWARSPLRLDLRSEFLDDSIRAWNTAPEALTEGSKEDNRAPIDKPPRLHLKISRLPQQPGSRLPLPPLRTPLKVNLWNVLFHDSISLKDLTDLSVYGGYGLTHDAQWWRRYFGEATAMQRVSVDKSMAVEGLVSALNPFVSSPFREHERPLFPDLKTLCLRGLTPAVPMDTLHDLRSCLQARRNDGRNNVMDIEFLFSDGMRVPADFEDSLAELEGLATYRIKTDTQTYVYSFAGVE